MAKTSTEVCTEALNIIAVAAIDEDLQAADYNRAKRHMDDIFTMLNDECGLAFEWTVETVPDGAFLPFARAIAGSVASIYGNSAVSVAAQAAATLNPRKTLYQIGIDGLKSFAAPDMNHENHVVRADYF